MLKRLITRQQSAMRCIGRLSRASSSATVTTYPPTNGSHCSFNQNSQHYNRTNSNNSHSNGSSNNNSNNSSESSKWSQYRQSLIALSAATLLSTLATAQRTDNCGIVGVVGDDNASDFLLEGLTILRNRGYDSAGVATIGLSSSNPSTATDAAVTELVVTKFASRDSTADSIDLVKSSAAAANSKHRGHRVGIGHTRWATHGGKTDQNAHPHSDQHNRIALIHNGTINNSHELRAELQRSGVKFRSETDSEVIAQLIGQRLDVGMDTKAAVQYALSRCDGSWGLAVINKAAPDEIVAACNGSPMVIGLGQGRTYIASETSAFSKYTKNFIAMKDGEIGVIHADGSNTLDISRVQVAPEHDIQLSPAPHPHFTIKECLEQPEAIARALSYGARMNGNRVVLGGLDMNYDRMKAIKHLLLTGCGTSKNAADFGAKLMRDLDCFDTATVLDAAEMRRSDIPNTAGGVLAVSQSGETKDVHRAVRVAEDFGVPCISVVNVVGSLIARTTGLGVYLNAGRENAVASTKAFTTQVTVLALIALWFRQLREEEEGLVEPALKLELLESLQRLPISFGMALRTRDNCKRIAAELLHKNNLFVLGKGYAEPIAHEGALKIKEITYVHAEGYSGGALKHGPFALIEGKEGREGQTPVILIIIDDDHAMHMRLAAEEVKARGAKVYIITDNPKLAEKIDDNPIIIPSNGPLTALIAVLPLQLIAYELAVLKGYNPDVPRNLAKAVTTD